MTPPEIPWYLSATAVSQFAHICGLGDPEDDAVFDRAEDALIPVAIEAATKPHTVNRNGLLVYPGSIPPQFRRPGMKTEHRLQLIVSTAVRVEGNKPQLVSVLVRGKHGR